MSNVKREREIKMTERKRSGYSRRATTYSLDEALRERLIVAVKYNRPFA